MLVLDSVAFHSTSKRYDRADFGLTNTTEYTFHKFVSNGIFKWHNFVIPHCTVHPQNLSPLQRLI